MAKAIHDPDTCTECIMALLLFGVSYYRVDTGKHIPPQQIIIVKPREQEEESRG